MRLFLIIFIVFLSACKTETTSLKNSKEGMSRLPGNGEEKKASSTRLAKKREAAIIPKEISLSRYGNPDSYGVKGKQYKVLRTAMGYEEKGIASWYGDDFHKKRTSSGEKYDMYAMTAAHKTLPLPSYVKVTNLKNGRHVVVKVNDRGPFHGNRIIDLSYAAAAELEFISEGTAPVKIETLGHKLKSAFYFLQAGAFRSKPLAENFQKKLVKITSLPVFIEAFDYFYVVKIGPFKDKNKIKKIKAMLSHIGVSGSFAVLN